jgi:ubiquitin carboxyl-terminal hydrolase 40
MLQVVGIQGVNESLENMFQKEMFNGDNQLTCDKCEEKTDSAKYLRIARLPPVLTFSLKRFDLDYATWTRKKVNQRFEFPLEVDMYKYTKEAEEGKEVDSELTTYELKSIIIHRGGAYGGHYHAYIKDSLKEGCWDLKMPEEFEKDPTSQEKNSSR